MVIVGAMGRKW